MFQIASEPEDALMIRSKPSGSSRRLRPGAFPWQSSLICKVRQVLDGCFLLFR